MRKKGKIKFNSVRFKLLIILILICNIPVAVSGYISYRNSYNILKNKLKVTSEQNISEINKSINNYFAVMTSEVSILSNDYYIKDNLLKNESAEDALNIIKEVKESNANILSAYYASQSKQMYIYPQGGIPKGFDPTIRPWYKAALDKKGEVAFSDVYKDVSTNNQIVSISKAIYDGDKLLGVAAMDVDLSVLTNSLSNSVVGKTGHISIADIHGIVVSHKDKKRIGTKKTSFEEIWNKISSKNEGFEEYGSKFTTYTTNKLTNWKIVASMDNSELLSDTNSIKYTTLGLSTLIFIIALVVSYFLANAVTKNIDNLMLVFGKASEGDLSSSIFIKSKDEFGELGNHFNSMLKKMHSLIQNIKNSSEEILNASISVNTMSKETTSAVGEVAATMDQMAQGAYSQAQDISDTVSEFNNLGNEITNIEKMTKSMSDISNNTDALSSRGLEAMKVLIDKTRIVRDHSSEASGVVQQMNEASKKIGSITETITGIAEQTNLLALNASIEAARAGEMGKGFAVVADEIRKLAEESTEATDEIRILIEDIANKNFAAASSVQMSVDMVEQQVESVRSTRDIFNEISSSIKELMAEISKVKSYIEVTNKSKDTIIIKIQNISAASEEASASTEEVSATTEEISASMNEFNNSSRRLEEIALHLQEEINKFKL